MTTKSNYKKNAANFFGAVGYLFCSFQWLWVMLLYFSLIKAFALFITPSSDSNVIKSTELINSNSNTLPIIIVAVITIIMVAFTIYIIVKIPSTIIKTSKKIVHEVAEKVTPAILRLQNRKDTKKNHIKLSSGLILILKIVLITVPIILSFMSQFIEKQMIDFYIVMYISLWLGVFSLIFFVSQYFIARLLLITKQNLW